MHRRVAVAGVVLVTVAIVGAPSVAALRADGPALAAAEHDPTGTPSTSAPMPAQPSPSPKSLTPTPRQSRTTSATPAPRRTRQSAPRTYVAPPPNAEPFTAPALVGTALVGCRYRDNAWTVTFTVTVRGGTNWSFANSNAQTMPYSFTPVSETPGSGGTTTARYEQQTPYFAKNADGSGGAPDSYDEHVRYYAIRDHHHDRDLGVKLPVTYQLAAHCTK